MYKVYYTKLYNMDIRMYVRTYVHTCLTVAGIRYLAGNKTVHVLLLAVGSTC